MFCPKCRAEYEEGITICSDCQVELVGYLPPENEDSPDFVDFKEVLATYNAGDVAFLKSLLDAEGFDYFFKGDQFTSMGSLMDPARLMVRSDQAKDAEEFLKNVELSVSSIDIDDDADEESESSEGPIKE